MLRSSNPLDQLFLAHYLRMAYPRGRIVILGADVLLRREGGAGRLSGIMTLTTFPLVTWEPHWTMLWQNGSGDSHRIYPSDDDEGLYVAARFLLHANAPGETKELGTGDFVPTDPNLPLQDYSPPIWSPSWNVAVKPPPPPIGWLSVLGRDDFWPVAALNTAQEDVARTDQQTCESYGCKTICWVGKATRSLGHVFYPPSAKTEPPPGAMKALLPLSMRASLFALCLWTLFNLACCSFASVTFRPNHRAYFVRIPGSSLQQRILLVIGCLALSSAATTLAWGCGVMSTDGVLLDDPSPSAWTALTIWILAGMALAINLSKEAKLSSTPTAPIGWPLIAYAGGTLAYYYALYWCIEPTLTGYNRFPVYWRSMNLTNGVSPVLPFLALSIGAYWWIWRSLQGVAFFGPDAPVLPPATSLRFPDPWHTPVDPLRSELDRLNMFSREGAAKPVLTHCKPLARTAWVTFGVTLILEWVIASLLSSDSEGPIRSLGAHSYAQFVCFLVAVLVAVMIANASQLMSIWIGLRQLLVHLDRVPLRRSMAAIRGVSWNSVWKISGNVLDLRYRLLVTQLECVTHLENSLKATKVNSCAFLKGDFGYKSLHGADGTPGTFDALHNARTEFGDWYARNWNNPDLRNQDKMKDLQENLSAFAGMLLARVLLPAWRLEAEDLLPCNTAERKAHDPEKGEKQSDATIKLAPHIRHAEELVCYVYLAFIQNILGRMRTLTMGIMGLFIAVTLSLACYPFDPRTVVNGVLILLFIFLGTVIVMVYAQMHRDPILSALTDTKPGELDPDFWIKLISFGAAPMMGLLATIFPGVADFLFSWIAPGVSAAK